MRLPAPVLSILLLALPAAPALAAWKLQHEFDFRTARALDPAFWSVETGWLRNQESQYYTPANVTLPPGFLRIEARREQVPNAAYRAGARGWRQQPAFAHYTSGSIATRAEFLYGRFEIVARSPGGAGAWPAIWLVHEGRGPYGEIDIHESVGKHRDTAFAGVHYGRTPNSRQYRNANRVVPGFEGGWHTHTVEWTPERIVCLLDGEPLMQFDPRSVAAPGFDPLRQPMRLHINLALGGTWGGPIADSRLPARLDIAAVRIWSWERGAGDGPAAPALPASASHDEAVAPAGAVPQATGAAPPPGTPRWGR
jgi:beta-glucanase (GH16 family)